MTVITISGKAESGKDTTANILKERLEDMGYSVLITHYADLLKYICKQFFGWDGQKNEEGRTLLQRVGTEGIRKYNPDYWVRFIMEILAYFQDEWDFVLIPDARFPNEIDLMKEDFDCISVQIYRPNYENHLTEEQRKHISEVALDEYRFDYQISNPGNLGGLVDEINRFINQMFEGFVKKTLLDKIREHL